MFKNKFNLKDVATGVVCLAVCVVMSCGGSGSGGKSGSVTIAGKTVKVDNETWPSASVLAKYGLDGLKKPDGYDKGVVVETAGTMLVINFSAKASTSAAVKNFFSDNSWEGPMEMNSSEVKLSSYGKEVGDVKFAANFTEMDGLSFQIQIVKQPL